MSLKFYTMNIIQANISKLRTFTCTYLSMLHEYFCTNLSKNYKDIRLSMYMVWLTSRQEGSSLHISVSPDDGPLRNKSNRDNTSIVRSFKHTLEPGPLKNERVYIRTSLCIVLQMRRVEQPWKSRSPGPVKQIDRLTSSNQPRFQVFTYIHLNATLYNLNLRWEGTRTSFLSQYENY